MLQRVMNVINIKQFTTYIFFLWLNKITGLTRTFCFNTLNAEYAYMLNMLNFLLSCTIKPIIINKESNSLKIQKYLKKKGYIRI